MFKGPSSMSPFVFVYWVWILTSQIIYVKTNCWNLWPSSALKAISTDFLIRSFFSLTSRPPPAAHACPSGLKRHSRREIFSIFFKFFKILKFYIFLVIPRSWGVQRYPCFKIIRENSQDRSAHTHELCFIT